MYGYDEMRNRITSTKGVPGDSCHCGVMDAVCICPTVHPVGLPIPQEPARQDLPASPSWAYAEGWREGWIAGVEWAMKQKEQG